MANLVNVLLVEYSQEHSDLIVREMCRGGYTVNSERVTSPSGLSDALLEKNWDLVISDYYMSGFNGYDALKVFKRSGVDCPFIIVSGTPLDESGLAVMAAGADEYLTKDNLDRLVSAINKELKQAEVRRQWNRAKEKLQHIAYHDLTTDLPNHALFRERIDYAIANAKREKRQAALLSLKINRFRMMNETLGDHLFDILLTQFGRRLRAALDQSITVACLRSNEFGVLMPLINSSEQVVQIVHSIITSLEPPFTIGEGLAVEIQATFGIALFPEHATAPDLLLKRVRAAAGTARANRLPYNFYSGEQDESRHRRLSLLTDLRRAIIGNELFLVYQPKVTLGTLEITGVEALVRWRHPRLGVLIPEHFIPLAEETGLIMPLTLWVLNEALRQCRLWNEQSRQLTIAINLSPMNVQSSVFPEQIRGLLASSGVSASQIELEITESALMDNAKQSVEILTAIKQMGFRLTVDDFGTGYSSLAHLQRLPIDSIKIDKSFVMKLATEARDAVIVRSTVHLAHNLGLTVVAEGVENREALRMLVTMGCDLAQGYYISHPRLSHELPHGFCDWLTHEA